MRQSLIRGWGRVEICQAVSFKFVLVMHLIWLLISAGFVSYYGLWLTKNLVTNSSQDGIKTNDGTLHQVDTILFATGFDLEMSTRPFDLVGLSGQPTNIALKANFGITHPEYPNAFVLLGFKSLFLENRVGKAQLILFRMLYSAI